MTRTLNFYSPLGENKVEQDLRSNKFCIVIDHRQSGKTTLAKEAARNLSDGNEDQLVLYISLRGLKVIFLGIHP